MKIDGNTNIKNSFLKAFKKTHKEEKKFRLTVVGCNQCNLVFLMYSKYCKYTNKIIIKANKQIYHYQTRNIWDKMASVRSLIK